MYRGRILAITDAAFAKTGYGVQADKVLSELVKRGWEVYQYACNYFPNGTENVVDGYVDHNGIKVILYPKIWGGQQFLYPTKEDVKKTYDELKPDIVWSLNDFYRVAPYLELGQEFIDKWVHWLPIDNDMPDPIWSKKQQAMKFLVYMSDFGLKLDGDRVGKIHYKSNIYLATNPREFYALSDKQTIKKTHGMQNNFVILTVGKHQPRKMIYHTAQAVCKFMQTHADAYWVCKSNPEDGSMLKEIDAERDLRGIAKSYGVENRVMFVANNLNTNQMNDMYNTADVFIHLSGGEGYGIPYMEAMLAETPCILSKNTTSPELLNNGELGWLVDIERKKYVNIFATNYDVASLDKANQALESTYKLFKESPEELKKLGTKARNYHINKCSLDIVTSQWEETFQRIIRYNNKILWHCFFGAGVGFSSVSESMIPILEENGYDVYANDFKQKQSPILDPHIAELYDKYLTNKERINFKEYPQVMCWLMENYDWVSGKWCIGYSFLESTKLRPPCVGYANTMAYLTTSCEHNKNIQTTSGVKIPIRIVPPHINPQQYSYIKREHTDKPFTFLHIGVIQERKNTGQTVEGYCRAFPDDGRTRLIIKSNHFGMIEQLKAANNARKDIEFIYTNANPLSLEAMNELYKSADCYINISHGEGIGMPDLEAMATGLPVIGNNWDARQTFLDDDVGWMVQIYGWYPAYNYPGLGDSGVWAHYSGDDYIRILKYVYEHQDEVRIKGAKAAKRIADNFTASNAFKNIDDLFMEIYARKKGIVIDTNKDDLKKISPSDRILVGIPTKDRTDSLVRLFKSLNKQNVNNFDVMITDDSKHDSIEQSKELKKEIESLSTRGIKTTILYGGGNNQAHAHTRHMKHALDNGYALVFRLDDDVVLEPDHIEIIFNEFVKDDTCRYAAMGGIIMNPFKPGEQQVLPNYWRNIPEVSGKIENLLPTQQMYKYPDIESRDDIQHLYSSYIYRPELLNKVGGFPSNLSKVAFREETLPVYELYLQGYKLKIMAKAWAYHFHEAKGGCRSVAYNEAHGMYNSDEEKYKQKVAELKKKYNRK